MRFRYAVGGRVKNVWSKNIQAPKNLRSKNISGPKKLWVQKILWAKKNCGSKNLSLKNILSQKILVHPFLRHRVKYGGLDGGFHSLALE